MRDHALAGTVGSIEAGRRSVRPFGVLAVLILSFAALVGIGASASSALAATAGQSYSYKSDVGAGETGANDQVFNSVAVSSADGRVFIGRQFDFNALGGFEVLNPDGTSLVRLDTENRTNAIAVTPDGSAVYTLNASGSPAPYSKYVSDGQPTPTYTQDPTWAPSFPGAPGGIAVDPVTGDVLMTGGGPIYRFDSATGALLSTIDGSSITDGAPFSPVRIAVAPNRDVYAQHLNGRLEHMGADGSWKGRLPIPGLNSGNSAPSIAVNSQNGDVAVWLAPNLFNANDTVIQIYSSSNVLKDTFRIPADRASDSKGLAFSPDGTKLYVGHTFGTASVFALGTRPGLDAPTISQLTPTSFHVADVVATNGESTAAHFEYCLATDPCTSYLTTNAPSPWRTLSPDYSGLTGANDPIANDLVNLEPQTDYLVRAVAVNDATQVENITASVLVHTPTGPPVVVTGAATADEDSAQLNGTIDTLRSQTTYHFEYGLDTSYGGRVPAKAEAIAGSLRTRTFTQTAKGLQPGTTYHYRLVATNAAGTTAGADRTFTTVGSDEVAPKRGYEQVTSPDKKGLALIPNFGFQAGPNGGAIEYAASTAAADAQSAAQIGRYIAVRGATGWNGQQPLDPPLSSISVILSSATQAVSADFEHALVVSQKALTPDAVENATNIYVSDVKTGAYHLVGTATEGAAFTGMVGTKQQRNFIAGAPDFSWVVLISRFRLLPGAPQVAMYKWSQTGGLSIVSRLPGDAIPAGDTWYQAAELVANRLVSDDGETVAFSLTSGEVGVYRRSGGQTVAISESEVSGDPPGAQPGTALGMSRDGRYVVFLSNNKLTDDADLSGTNLYRYDASSNGLTYLGNLSSDGAIDVPAISDDGETVYFNDKNGALSVWRNGQVDIVSPFPSRDGLAYASPNGRYLAYMENGSVYLYDADAGEETCISCTSAGQGGGAQLPDGERNMSNYRPSAVTNDGHAYFGTKLVLLGADRNNAADVYEYYKGRLTLISPGDGDYNALLVDISPDGHDVFFTTAQGLVRQDTDGLYDIYDARIGGGFAAQNPPLANLPCLGDACQAPPIAPPAALTPGSALSTGEGNSRQAGKRCGKGTRQVRRNGKVRCVKKQKGQHTKKRNAKQNRGASR